MEDKVKGTESSDGSQGGMPSGKIMFVRLNYQERLQHYLLVGTFIILAITGFALNIPEDVLELLGSAGEMVFFWRSVLHRAAGTVMILVSIYHVYYLIFTSPGRRWFSDMMMGPSDLKEMAWNMQYYIGLKDSPPEFDRFCYKHKMEYGALLFGTVVMSVTGLLMWTEHNWSKFVLDISALLHGMEAILASLAITVWHLYEVHLRPHKFPVDNMWLHGLIDEEEMKEEYPLHYKKIMEDPELQKIYIKRGGDE